MVRNWSLTQNAVVHAVTLSVSCVISYEQSIGAAVARMAASLVSFLLCLIYFLCFGPFVGHGRPNRARRCCYVTRPAR